MMELIGYNLEFLPIIDVYGHFPSGLFAEDIASPPPTYQIALFFFESKVHTLAQFNPFYHLRNLKLINDRPTGLFNHRNGSLLGLEPNGINRKSIT